MKLLIELIIEILNFIIKFQIIMEQDFLYQKLFFFLSSKKKNFHKNHDGVVQWLEKK